MDRIFGSLLVQYLCLCVALTVGVVASATALQIPAPLTKLEVATIKPSRNHDPNNKHDTTKGRRLVACNISLRNLIMMAYDVDLQQITSVPEGLATNEYDIDAESVEGGQLEEEREEQALLRELLADRFKLAFHWEKKTLPVYVLTAAKNGPRLKAADPDGARNSSCKHPGDCTFKKKTLPNFA